MTRRYLTLLFLLLPLLAILGLWLSHRRRQEVDLSWERVRERGILRVGLDPSFPPFEVLGVGGELEGYDVNLAWEMAKTLGVEADFVVSGFDGLYGALVAGRFDCIISSLPYDPTLTRDFGYSRPYFNAGYVLVISASSGVEEISGVRWGSLGAELGSEGEMVARRQLLKSSGGGSLHLYLRPQEVLEAVAEGGIPAGVVDNVSAQQFLAQGKEVEILSPSLTRQNYVIAVRAPDRALLAKIDEVLAELEARGLLGKLGSFSSG